MTSKPGAGGEGGDPGPKGPSGFGGQGGDGDSASLLWNHMDIGPGPIGDQNTADPGNLGKGPCGETGACVPASAACITSNLCSRSAAMKKKIPNGILVSLDARLIPEEKLSIKAGLTFTLPDPSNFLLKPPMLESLH